MKKAFKIIEYTFYAILALLVILVLASTLPIPGNLKLFVVQSGSMEPTIKTGSLVIDRASADYAVGDIITFGPNTKKNPPTTHRITEVKTVAGETVYVTKGDANDALDSKEVKRGEVIGKTQLIIPYVGYAVSAAKQPIGFVVLIVIPAVVIIIDEIKKIKEEVKKMARPVKSSKDEGSSKDGHLTG